MQPFRLLLLLILLLPAVSLTAQTQCGYADEMDFPVDMTQFTLAQDFASASYRHQGRYHTGEDWYGGEGTSYGTPVRASATGRVTFSSPNGWGVDGGVIIIEHTFRDNSVAYSMYGHITDQTGVGFPATFSCVRIGDVIAAVGDVRPAPHLHFEMRINQPDIPGAGYTFDDPTALGFRRPTKFILNFRARSADGYRFTADIADEAGAVAPPVVRSDSGLTTLDANRVLNISYDGRVLWRTQLGRHAVALVPDQSVPDGVLVIYADGSVQTVSPDGALGGSRSTGQPVSSAATPFAGGYLFSTPDGGLVALDSALDRVLWTVGAVGKPARIAASSGLIGIMTEESQSLTISPDGMVIDTALLQEPGALNVMPTGDLLVYSRGGLWQIDGSGVWSLLRADAPSGGAGAAVVETNDGALYAFDGAALRAYTPDLAWETALPDVRGVTSLMAYDGILLLTSTFGDVIAVQAAGGGVCNRIRLYGDARSRLWQQLGNDGVLRIHVADQVVGFEWNDFLMACGS